MTKLPQQQQAAMATSAITTQSKFNVSGYRSVATSEQLPYVLEGISLEVEARSSDFADLSIRGLLEAGLLLINLDEDNVRELVLSRDLSLNAQVEISNVSVDKRAIRESQSFYLS